MNLAEILRASADASPGAPSLIFHGRAITYADLDERADLTASALAGLGLRPGDRAALLAGNVPEFVSGFFGILRAGAIVCPLNVQLTPEELGYILADAGAKVVVSEIGTLPLVLAVRDRLADLETIVVIGGPPAPKGTVSLEEAMRSASAPPEAEVSSDAVALLAYTSGTTADPKGAMLTHGNIRSNLDQIRAVDELVLRPGDVVLLALPLYHAYALVTGLLLAIAGGAAGLLVEGFDPTDSLDLVTRHGVTVVIGAPPMYAAWSAAEGATGSNAMSGVRLATSGVAPLRLDLFDAFRRRYGVTISEGYGLTEAGPAVTSSSVGASPTPGSIGLPLPGIEVRLLDSDGEDIEEDDDPGANAQTDPLAFLLSPTCDMQQTMHATREVLLDGWLRTGDVAVRSPDGSLSLVDRKTDVIIVSGFNVYPTEVEDAIAAHPHVAEAGVVGIPDDLSGEAVQAWVVPTPGASIDAPEILDFLHGHLARFKWPKDVRIVEELPHLVTGKVVRRALRSGEVRHAVEQEGVP